jgi:hypothetical protein
MLGDMRLLDYDGYSLRSSLDDTASIRITAHRISSGRKDS